MKRERSNIKKANKMPSMPLYGSEEVYGKKKSAPRGLVKKLVRRMESDDADIYELRSHRV